MKKVLVVLGGLCLAGQLWASCMGPFCWDDRGAYIGGVVNDGNGAGLPSKTAAQVLTSAPTVAGQEIFCSNCTNFNSAKGGICISTGTGTAAYVTVSSLTAVTACQ